ncbi:hypothetical protein, partial [Endozoicomonas sp.]|uniref:hypothetical protein n=1 Tax=Endozoicomonas sp. TaxID=1892382 RepID=UPI00383B509A
LQFRNSGLPKYATNPCPHHLPLNMSFREPACQMNNQVKTLLTIAGVTLVLFLITLAFNL